MNGYLEYVHARHDYPDIPWLLLTMVKSQINTNAMGFGEKLLINLVFPDV